MFECSKGNFKVMPIYQTDDYSMITIKEQNNKTLLIDLKCHYTLKIFHYKLLEFKLTPLFPKTRDFCPQDVRSYMLHLILINFDHL